MAKALFNDGTCWMRTKNHLIKEITEKWPGRYKASHLRVNKSAEQLRRIRNRLEEEDAARIDETKGVKKRARRRN